MSKTIFWAIIPVLIWACVPFADAWNDARKWKSKKTIVHWFNAVKRIVFLAATITAFPDLWMNKYALTAFIPFGLFYFWLVFNLRFNKLTGRPPDYLGDAWLDKIEAHVPFKQAFWTKLIAAAFCLLGYFVSVFSSLPPK